MEEHAQSAGIDEAPPIGRVKGGIAEHTPMHTMVTLSRTVSWRASSVCSSPFSDGASGDASEADWSA